MSDSAHLTDATKPLTNLDEWEDFVLSRYPAPEEAYKPQGKEKDTFRDYRREARSSVKEFYRLNHRYQTRDFVLSKKNQYRPGSKPSMGIWKAMEYLNTLVDDSDPDTDLSQIEHLLQSAEAARSNREPRWFILTALIHDLGKVLCLYGEPQWAVVGDTFPVGCAFSDKIVFSEFFADNPDSQVPAYQTRLGVYRENGGLDEVDLSWGHDEYLYQVTRPYLPEPAQYIIRYHSFYPAHREGEYGYLMNDRDRKMFDWVKRFNPYDLYSKSAERPDVERLKPFYQELIAEHFPAEIKW
jgi:inositol oxygenase